MYIPDVSNLQCLAFKHYSKTPEVVPLCILRKDVIVGMMRLYRSGSTGSANTVELGNWLFCFTASSEVICKEMAEWAECLTNKLLPWATICAIMACRLVALDKHPGTRSVGNDTKTACSNLQLYAGTEAGIEGSVHMVQIRQDQQQAAAREEEQGGATATTVGARMKKEEG
eukprot:5371416-Ditylum_brightwellii.AAC.1